MSGTAPRSRRLDQTIQLLHGIQRRSELAGVALPAVCSLLGAEVAGFNAWGPRRVSARPVMVPGDAMRRADLASYARFSHQQPLIELNRRRAAVGAYRTTDVVSARDFLRTDLYHHFYRPLEIKYQLGLAVPEHAGWTVGYAFSRTSHDFEDKEVAVMAELRESLAIAHHRVAAESLREQFEALSRQLLDNEGGRCCCCMVVIDERGRVDIAAGPLLPQVTARFGTIVPGALAPTRLASLAAASRVPFRLRATLGHGTTADVMSVPAADGGGSLLFELRDPADLRARFGLTAGEYQTLANIARLETNERAAAAEGVSIPTIEKRISSVIHKMHVQTRVGAVREFLRATNQ